MNKLKDLSFDEFSRLVSFLNKDSNGKLTERLMRFFPNANSLHLLRLNYLADAIIDKKDDAEDLFNDFKNEVPELDFDETGRSQLRKLNDTWRITLSILDTIFDAAEFNLKNCNFKDASKAKINSQVYYAKTLGWLSKKVEKPAYLSRKILYIKQHPDSVISSESLSKAEKQLSSLIGGNDILERLLIRVSLKKKYENYKTFAEDFFKRVDCLYRDKNLEEKSNRDFLENLNKLKNS